MISQLNKNPFIVYKFADSNSLSWNSLLKTSNNFTFQFERRFLNFYQESVEEHSIMAEDELGKPLALLPLAVNRTERKLVSFSKSTYGGLIFADGVNQVSQKAILNSFLSYLAKLFPGYELELRLPPNYIQHRSFLIQPWLLWNFQFSPLVINIHNVIDLKRPLRMKSSRIKRNFSSDVYIVETSSTENISALWFLLEKQLSMRHAAKPAHSAEQLIALKELFPEEVKIFIAKSKAESLLGGLVFFNTNQSYHLQYMAISDIGRSQSIGDSLVLESIELAKKEQKFFFNFGHSNENLGKTLNDGLFAFKSKFGGSPCLSMTWNRKL